MPNITGPYEPPFDPHERPPTWLVPLGQGREATLVALCKGLPAPAAMAGRRAGRAVRPATVRP